MVPDTSYRADIDGLRAVAVLSVIIFHANKSWLPGGFVGVDVFFVISGYVITKSLLGYSGTLSQMLRDFYERRIRRLFPAALLVVLYTTVMTWHLLPPEALAEYARSLVAFITFWSNWFFWSISGYFDGPSELKPLLHTWSLSIEEQFYLLFPFPMLLLMKRGRKPLAMFFGAILVLSFAISAWLVATGGTEAAFFNSFGRFWEIALGGLLACGVMRSPSPRLAPIVGISGLAMILASFILLSEYTPFPGVLALLPTLGTAAVILAAQGPVNRLLATRLMTWVGALSYGLYLWHWPIFVTIAYGIPGATAWHYLAGIAATFAAAIMSFYGVEQPVRYRRALPLPRHAFAMFAAFAPTVIAAGVAGVAGAGFPSRFPITLADYEAFIRNQQTILHRVADYRTCWLAGDDDISVAIAKCAVPEPEKTNVAVVGDSHAAHLIAGLQDAWPNVNFDLLAANSCPLVLGYSTDTRLSCRGLIGWLADPTNYAGYDALILSTRNIERQKAEDIARTAIALAERVPQHVIVSGPAPFYAPNMPTIFPTLIGRPADEIDARLDAALSADQFENDRMLRTMFEGSEVTYVSVIDVICNGRPDGCQHLDEDGWPILIDNSHMSSTTSARLAHQFRDSGALPL